MECVVEQARDDDDDLTGERGGGGGSCMVFQNSKEACKEVEVFQSRLLPPHNMSSHDDGPATRVAVVEAETELRMSARFSSSGFDAHPLPTITASVCPLIGELHWVCMGYPVEAVLGVSERVEPNNDHSTARSTFSRCTT